MPSVGLDIGTSHVKCVSDNGKFTFPALYAYANRQKWDSEKTLLSGVGEEALRIAQRPNAIIITPMIEGRPVHQKGVEEIVKEVGKRLNRLNVSNENNKIDTVVVGLPYDGIGFKDVMLDIINNILSPKNCLVIPQVIGTIEAVGRKSATILNIGQGTTEIVAIENMAVIAGRSLIEGCDYLTRDLGEFAHLDLSIYENDEDEMNQKCEMLADLIVNKVDNFISLLRPMDECSRKVILTGGGAVIPFLKAAIIQRMKVEIEVADDPVMSNAVGLHKIAKRTN